MTAQEEKLVDLKDLFYLKNEDETNFKTWLSESITHENGFIKVRKE